MYDRTKMFYIEFINVFESAKMAKNQKSENVCFDKYFEKNVMEYIRSNPNHTIRVEIVKNPYKTFEFL